MSYYCNAVGWTWWDWSLTCRTYLPSVLWHYWLGHLTCKNLSRFSTRDLAQNAYELCTTDKLQSACREILWLCEQLFLDLLFILADCWKLWIAICPIFINKAWHVQSVQCRECNLGTWKPKLVNGVCVRAKKTGLRGLSSGVSTLCRKPCRKRKQFMWKNIWNN